MTHLKKSVSIVAISLALAPAAFAQESDEDGDERRLKSVTVTATKRSEDAQSIPVAVTALGEQDLEAFGVKNFTDYLVQLPGVTAGGSGPGQATIYIRGLASTTPNLTTAGVAGLAPNVSFYLDEQPLAQPGRNLDVYTADLQRIEVLSGPQGTLFGSSSQAGTVRLITNKPDLNGFSAYQKASTSFTDGGEMSNSVEAMLNVPFNDRFALRGVVYTDKQGGYIDNVHGTIDIESSAIFRALGSVRDNGVPITVANRAGKLAPAMAASNGLDGMTILESDNAGLVEDNFNDTIYSGFRLSGVYEIDENGKLLVSHSRQRLDSEGVFFTDPKLDEDYSIQRHSDDNFEDSFQNTSWTFDTRLGQLEALYTGAFTERTTDQIVDYTDYLFVGKYLPYYICDHSVYYASDTAAPTGTCQPPNLFVKSLTETKVQTHEMRFNTPATNQYRATFGAFFSDLELTELNDFTYPGSVRTLAENGTDVGFVDNYPLTNTTALTSVPNGSKQGPGYYSHAGPFPTGVIFRNDVRRTDKQLGMFGEATFDFSDQFAVTLGARWYNIEVDLEGSANSSWGNRKNRTDQQGDGTNISTKFASGNTAGTPDKATKDGMIFKLSGSWTPQDDLLFFATYSEGFRQGLLNRPGGASSRDDSSDFVVPYLILSDEVKNFDLGWKTELNDNSLRFNGSIFFVQIEGLQTTIFDPSISNLFFSDNAADAEIQGVEGDFTWAPEGVEGLILSGAFSFLNTEITNVITPTGDVKKGEPLAFAPSYQMNFQARYEWEIEQEFAGSYLTAHFMPQLIMSDSSFSDIIEINKIESDGYVMIGGTLGVSADNWSAEIFATNLGNENAFISNNFVFDRERATPARPRTIGVRMSYDF